MEERQQSSEAAGMRKIWIKAGRFAAETPSHRNRYADFLRAVSILVVVVGHWLMAAPRLVDGQLQANHLLAETRWTHWLTWLLQVMPIFFLVGGFSNATALGRNTKPYGEWLRERLRRLVVPALPLLAVWTVAAGWALSAGFSSSLLKVGSQVALVPVWFLAVYLVIVALAPLTWAAWRRWGWRTVVIPGLAAGAVDLIAFATNQPTIGYLNYVLVWGTVHQLGYAWAEGRLGSVRANLTMAMGGLSALATLVALGPYPVAMVGLTENAVNNTQPPKVTLLALGLFQSGLLLALQEPARRWLAKFRPWRVTVAINGSIMSLYLWHLTAMVGLIGLSMLAGGWGLTMPIDTPLWWLTRPLWMLTTVVATLPFLALFSRFERPKPDQRPAPAEWRVLLGVAGFTAGLGLLAYYGIADAEGLNGVAITLPFAAALVGGVVALRPDADDARK